MIMDKTKFRLWLKRVGAVGFLFFLAKGIFWIYVFMSLGKCATGH